MPVPVLTTPDPDPYDQARTIHLASAGLSDYCATVVIDGNGTEHLMLAKYGMGTADYLTDWRLVAPHELV